MRGKSRSRGEQEEEQLLGDEEDRLPSFPTEVKRTRVVAVEDEI